MCIFGSSYKNTNNHRTMNIFYSREHKLKIRELEQAAKFRETELGRLYAHRNAVLDQEYTTRKLEVDKKLQDYREHQLTEQSKVGVQTNQKILEAERSLAQTKERINTHIEQEERRLTELRAEKKGIEQELTYLRKEAAMGLGSWTSIERAKNDEIARLNAIVEKLLAKDTTNLIVPPYVVKGKLQE